ncbi:MAG: hypothetical protein ABJ092_13015 [Gillisia sp.]
MKTIVLLITFFTAFTAHSQIAQKYVSKNSDYFPAKLYLLEDSKFLYKEIMGKGHVNKEYFQKGNYQIKGNTLYLLADSSGFNCDQMVKEPNKKLGIIYGKNIHLLREDGSEYLELKRQNFRNKKEILDCL